MSAVFEAIGRRLAHYLSERRHIHSTSAATPIEKLRACLMPGDILLVEGDTRISAAIKYLTQSTWSHAALYIGDAGVSGQFDEGQCFVEADLATGVRAVGFDEFRGMHTRICRPVGLTDAQRHSVVAYVVSRIGHRYDLRNVFDLARYLLPTPPVPTRFRRRMIGLGSGDPTRAICSTLVSQAFQSIGYPILPAIEYRPAPSEACPGCVDEVLHIRHHSLFTPRDFDVSPYFQIVKPTIGQGFDVAALMWDRGSGSESKHAPSPRDGGEPEIRHEGPDMKRAIFGASMLAVMLALSFLISAAMTPKLKRPGAIEQLLPSVVRITTHALVPETKDDQSVAQSTSARTKVQESFGSGFIVDKSGYIVTNRHVVKGAYEIIVNLHDGTPLRARLIGDGNDIDLALLKVETGKPLKPVVFGDSVKLRLGDDVVAVGNPFGLGTTVTSGVISAHNRNLGFSMFDSFIQTDAPINHGNSGGPLFNMKGEVVGVNTAYYTGGNAKSGSIGLGFAIPSETTEEMVGLLRKFGYLKIGWIGVDGATLEPEMINSFGLTAKTGAIVSAVHDNGPAKGKLLTGDIILEVDKRPLEDMRMLRRHVAASLGTSVRLGLLRKGKAETIAITPAEWPGGYKDGKQPLQPAQDIASVQTGFGVACARLSNEIRDEFKIDRGQGGVIVTEVNVNSPASEAGLQIGDVLVALQLEPVNDPTDIATKMDAAVKSGRDYVTMLIRSRGEYKYITLPLKWAPPPQSAG